MNTNGERTEMVKTGTSKTSVVFSTGAAGNVFFGQSGPGQASAFSGKVEEFGSFSVVPAAASFCPGTENLRL